VHEPDYGPDILDALADYPDERDRIARERAEQQERLLAPRLPRRHYAKVDQIPLPVPLQGWDWSTGGVLLTGGKGSGKTQAACRMVVEAVRSLRVAANRVAWVSEALLFTDLRRAMDDKKHVPVAVQAMRDADLVVLDDICKARLSPWVEEMWFTFCDELYSRDVDLLCTTNWQPHEIEGRIGAYSADRIAEMTTPVILDGPSYRSKQ
jgi:DNA replication protein DnaC